VTAVVALPLAIAFAIASGVPPILGLYTAIIAGVIAPISGGSRFSITGPTGAMTVVILSTLNRYGLEGLLLAGFLAGALQFLFGAIRLGRLVKFIPLPVVSGFTAGIGVLILVGQIPNLLGLELTPHEFILENLLQIFEHIEQSNLYAIGIGVVTSGVLLGWPLISHKSALLKSLPPSIFLLVGFTALVGLVGIPTPIVGEIPAGLPQFSLISFDLELLRAVFPAAFTIALLGSVEALLCAVVCDGMTNTRHDSNRELMGQGLVNLIMPFFTAIPATAAIARSAINIREGAKTRLAAIYHGLILLLILLFFGPIAGGIPNAFLAGVLVAVSLRMINVAEIKRILRVSPQEAGVLLVTLLLTVIVDLVVAIQIGMLLAILLLFVKLTKLLHFEGLEEHDINDEVNVMLERDYVHLRNHISVYTLHGPFFFGAMGVFEQKINEHMELMKPYVLLRMRHVPMIDATGVESLKAFIRERHKRDHHVILINVQPVVRSALFADEEFVELIQGERIFNSSKEALHASIKSYEISQPTNPLSKPPLKAASLAESGQILQSARSRPARCRQAAQRVRDLRTLRLPVRALCNLQSLASRPSERPPPSLCSFWPVERGGVWLSARRLTRQSCWPGTAHGPAHRRSLA